MAKAEEMNIYEIGYLLVPYLPAEEVGKTVETSIKAKILASGGEVTSELAPVMTRLSYVITKIINNKHTKFSDGYFGALRFKLTTDEIVKLKDAWSKDDLIIRSLIISLPQGSETIVAPKRSFAPRREDKPFEIERVMPEKEEEKPALSAEELDQEIDKLVV